MERRIYLILLLCGILSQGVCSLSNENYETSSGIHIRQKRVAGGVRHAIDEAPFLVTILLRGNYHAPASLLTADTAITAAHVFRNQDQSAMFFESRTIGGPRTHRIERLIFLDPRYNDTHPTFKNLVLVKFAPSIYFRTSRNQPIRIHTGSIVEERLNFEFLNWAKPYAVGGRLTAQHYQSIPVQLISIQYCQQIYPGLIGPGNICTNSQNFGQHGTNNDFGAPLTVEQNLLGIMVFHGYGRATVPDVFMNLMDTDIRRWIHQHVPSLQLV